MASSITPPDPTLNHLLTLPPLLQPISPPLAALHLARVRLSLSVPTSSSYMAKSLDDWCNLCGGLRLHLGGAQPQPSTKKRKRKGGICGTCGEMYKKPLSDKSTLADYPPARRTRRMKRDEHQQQQQHQQQQSEITSKSQKGQQSKNIVVDRSEEMNKSESNLDVQPVSNPQQDRHPNNTSQSSTRPDVENNPPKLLSRPSLSHIPNSSPNLPTYPASQPKPTSTVNSSSGKKLFTGAGASASASANSKKKKKSGLAKLLAENKEREMVIKGSGGMWGLG
ncbi:hypothetical protein V865_001740 [Kwoniella europaea PYCC6329]|uniref:GATA-type domain-containing protein n=1 Tax=Kwoniella europaea PYCC6329 TaxID=1423913 RepID=A0AAX4KBY5_9TREE